jgi:hemerythrin-like metal-binding protein
MSIRWQDINSVNIKELDKHHKSLISILNSVSRSKSTKSVKKALGKLEDYARFHFAAEEKYFKEFSYPNRVAHTKRHQEFTKKIKKFEKEFESGKLELSELVEFLGQWWIGHINNADIKYSTFLNKRGVF